jgi:hypothetical protein
MVDLDELLRIARAIILVDVTGLKFIWPDKLPERWSQSTETALPNRVTYLTEERHGGVNDISLRRLQSSMTLQRSSRS